MIKKETSIQKRNNRYVIYHNPKQGIEFLILLELKKITKIEEGKENVMCN